MAGITQEHAASIQQYLQKRIRESGVDPAKFARLVRCLEISAGIRPRPQGPPLYAPVIIHFPELTPRPFHEPAQFPAVKILEDNYEAIRAELLDLLAERQAFSVHENSETLVGEGSWNAFRFYIGPHTYPDNHRRCPRTAEVIDSIADRTTMGKAYFSVAGPRTHIEPHHGPNNVHLRCHMGLVIPEGSEIRVADEIRSWQEGKVLVLDDSFEHEVWNRSDQERVVLIVDVWHPEVNPLERQVITELTAIMLKANIQVA